ncbi:MAG: ECF transporter S component [Clostridiales bacterium]|nr:ECF transporter S component [Clostridiales bacterium]
MKKTNVRKLVVASLFLALAMVLPMLTGQLPQLGAKLLPMHIPVLLCGFICGWQYGLIVGFTAPLLRSVIFGMPVLYPVAAAMAFELAAYGFFAAFLIKYLPKRALCIYPALICSMLLGRVVWGIARLIMYGIRGTAFTWSIFAAGAFVDALPGIIIQLIIIPPLVIALKRVEKSGGA